MKKITLFTYAPIVYFVCNKKEVHACRDGSHRKQRQSARVVE